MRFTFGLFLILSVFWGLNSSNDSGLLLSLGLLSVVFVLWLTRKMKLLQRESVPLHLLPRIFPFFLWLSKEIVVGSLYVLKRILAGDMALSPRIVTLKLTFKDQLSAVIFANSITLVPGTLCVQLADDSIEVHALTQELAEDLQSGQLARLIKGMTT